MKAFTRIILLVLFPVLFATSCDLDSGKDFTQFVDPFIGTANHGHTFPGATLPFGMVQLSPDNGVSGWDWCSGYNWVDSTLVGFSHKHLSGTGIGDLADILFLPTVKSLEKGEYLPAKEFVHHFKAWYTHDEETASPGYYSLLFRDWESHENPIMAELTATKRVGIHKYEFPADMPSNLILDLGFAINWDAPAETFIQVVNDTLITGYRKSKGWANNQQVFFAASFDTPLESYVLYKAGLEVESSSIVKGKYTEAIFSFGKNIDKLMMKVAISSATMEGALNNLKIEAPHWKFDKYQQEAKEAWNTELSKIEANTEDDALKRTFYTALYHSFIAPNLFSDVDGLYRGIDRRIHKTDGWDNYTVFSLWDTFRATHHPYPVS